MFIIALIGSALSPDANTSSNTDTLKPSQYISMNDVDMVNGNDNPNNQETEEGTRTENVITTLSDRNIYATCYDGNHDGPYAFNKEQVQMLAYYSNNTFNYSKIGVITHDEYEI
ncbi:MULTISPECIES: hypothetical protein [Methanosphaera]|uniref:Uncharacterized protein n=1 Tax=Methanosphaera stadtmanae (strain ATCC 43021 / DSM 3091 / JCM 11832 / MCB-3) TaxID=339860 RepID=Q2NGC7_METST|nr:MULTISPECIES: hypothetical protein [Methanosphaera]ABC57126.1 hypothetical protein Msp_0728 [Methanosphaera stadtmanae DSM 3091]OEC88999.1 hypothetical protein A9758_03455 [Methanosphaera sp. A6]